MSKVFLVALCDNSEGVFFKDFGDAYYTATGSESKCRGFGVTALGSDFRDRFDDYENFNLFELDLDLNVAKQLHVGDTND